MEHIARSQKIIIFVAQKRYVYENTDFSMQTQIVVFFIDVNRLTYKMAAAYTAEFQQSHSSLHYAGIIMFKIKNTKRSLIQR